MAPAAAVQSAAPVVNIPDTPSAPLSNIPTSIPNAAPVGFPVSSPVGSPVASAVAQSVSAPVQSAGSVPATPAPIIHTTTNVTTTVDPLAPVESLDTDPLTISESRLEDLPDQAEPVVPALPATSMKPDVQAPPEAVPVASVAETVPAPEVQTPSPAAAAAVEGQSVEEIIKNLSPEVIAYLQQKDAAAYDAEIATEPEVQQEIQPEVPIETESQTPEAGEATTPMGAIPIAAIAQDVIQGQLNAAQQGIEKIDSNQFGSRADPSDNPIQPEVAPTEPEVAQALNASVETETSIMTGTNPAVYASPTGQSDSVVTEEQPVVVESDINPVDPLDSVDPVDAVDTDVDTYDDGDDDADAWDEYNDWDDDKDDDDDDDWEEWAFEDDDDDDDDYSYGEDEYGDDYDGDNAYYDEKEKEINPLDDILANADDADQPETNNVSHK